MKKILKLLKIIAITVVVIVIVLIGLFLYFAGGMCGNKIHKEYLSPDKSLKALVFQRDCGATTGFSTQISILDSDENLENDSGNIFVIKGHPDNVALTLSWISNNELNIKHNLNGNEYTAKESLGWFSPIKITYSD